MLAKSFAGIIVRGFERRCAVKIGVKAFSTASDELPYVTNKADLKPSKLPHVPKQGSYKIDMEQGKTYFWCSCGLS